MRIDYPRARYSGARRFVPSWRQWLSLFGLAFLLGVVGVAVLYVRTPVPEASAVSTAQTTIVYWNDGKTELTRFGENRISVPLDEVPEHVRDAVLAAEDRGFYSHNGFSPSAIARAAWRDATGGVTQGGSTITQQYAKNAYLTQDQTVSRKVKELILAVKLDQTRSKDQILEDYLNTIYFGRGANGIEAASEAYFRKPASKLTVAEGAMIASVLRAPTFYDPDDTDGRERLENRWNAVLNAMVEQDWLTGAERADITFPKIRKAKPVTQVSGPNGYLVDMVRAELTRIGIDEEQLQRGGLRIVSTFDKDAQASAVEAVKTAGPQYATDGVRTGLVSMNPENGAVVAVYGGKNFAKQYNAATFGRMQAGSTFKIFGLMAGLDQGLTLSNTFDGSSPQQFTLPDGSTYPDPATDTNVPKGIRNSEGAAYGPVSLLKATEDSVNTAFVGMNLQIGPKKTRQAAVKLGIPKDTEGLNDLPINVLGTSSPRVIDMATAYATIANGGVRTERHVIERVTTSAGGLLHEARSVPERVFPQAVADEATFAMQHVVEYGTATAAQALERPAAGKTGTTDGYKAAWFAGYTPQLVTAVGMYREDKNGAARSLSGVGGQISFYGGGFPTRIWTAYMRGALEGEPVEEFAREVVGSAPVVAPSATGRPSARPSGKPKPGRPSAAPSTTKAPGPTTEPTPVEPTGTGEPEPTDEP